MIWSLLVLCALIFVHEFGHFIVAKWCGVGVVKFSIGFGPKLLSFRWGETVYQLSLIPLGGYVRMVGDMPDPITGDQQTDDAVRKVEATEEGKPKKGPSEEDLLDAQLAKDRSRWFMEKSLAQRSAIVFAGPLFNFLFAIVAIASMIYVFGEEVLTEDAVIGRVMDRSPAAEAGLVAKDHVLSVNGAPVENWKALADKIHTSDGGALLLAVERGAETVNIQVTPQRKEVTNGEGKTVPLYLIGIEPNFETHAAGFGRSAMLGALHTFELSRQTALGLWGLFTGQISPKELAGPIFIVQKTKDEAEKGYRELLWFSALISVSLAVLNLLPIPVLDGGHLLFFFLEALFGPISIRKKEIAQQVGVLALLCLMVYAIHNDLTRAEPQPPADPVHWQPATVDGQPAETQQTPTSE